MELYIHIPFCIKKCLYCDFLSAPADEIMQERYYNALKKQILCLGIREQNRSGGARTVSSIFIGGGTPSIWSGDKIVGLMDMIQAAFDVEDGAEISIEANPNTLTEEKLNIYRSCGINRLSIGLQSSDELMLRVLGRIHTFDDFLTSYDMARKAGFTNINIDIMSGLPGQSLESYENTLEKVVLLKPEHISAYSLIVEEGTPFFTMNLNLPDEDTEREMYYSTKRILKKAGYERYEISNYAKPGYECRHNLGYWSDIEYLGIGLGASSLDNNIRYRIITELPKYLEIMEGDAPIEEKLEGVMTEKEERSRSEHMSEYCYLGLRKTEGLSRRKFMNTFGRSLDIVFEDSIRRYTALELLISDGDMIRLSDKGLDVSNIVMADFLLDEETQ